MEEMWDIPYWKKMKYRGIRRRRRRVSIFHWRIMKTWMEIFEWDNRIKRLDSGITFWSMIAWSCIPNSRSPYGDIMLWSNTFVGVDVDVVFTTNGHHRCRRDTEARSQRILFSNSKLKPRQVDGGVSRIRSRTDTRVCIVDTRQDSSPAHQKT